MFKIALAIAGITAMLTPAAGEDFGAKVARQALRCANAPPALIRQWPDARATFDVTLDGQGRVTGLSVVEHSPQDREIAMAFARGLQLCAPYGAPPAGAGVYRVELQDGATMVIDPFAGR